MKFIGRELELNKLNKVIQTDSLTFSLIYGRRRVGKSELVKQAIKNSNDKIIYYECKQVAEESNVFGVSEVLEEAFELPKLGFNDMESLLKYIFELSVKEKMILVLDEYPYLRESVRGMDSILQALVDKYKDILYVLKNKELLDSAQVGVGGYSVVFNESIEIQSNDLREIGLLLPLTANDFYNFVSRNIVDTTQACEMLQCSRQNLSYLVNFHNNL